MAARPFLRKLLVTCLVLLAALAACVLAVWLALGLLISPARVCRMARSRLAEELGCHVEVGGAEVGLLSGVVLRGIRLREDAASEPWASAEELRLSHRVAALLRGQIDVVSVHVVRPQLVVNDTSLGRLRRLAEKPSGDARFPSTIVVEGGALRVERTSALPGVEELHAAPISIRVSNPDQRGKLVHVLAEAALAVGNVALELQVDQTQQATRFHGSANQLRLQGLPRQWLPEEVRARREVRELQGVVSAVVDGRVAWGGARPSVSHVARLHFDEVSFQPEDIGLAVRDLSGDATVIPGRLTLANVTGRLGPSRLKLDDFQLNFGPSAAPGDLHVRGTVRDVVLDGPVRAALPQAVQAACKSLGVRAGAADVEFRLSRQGKEKPQLTLDVELRELVLQPQAFAYALPPVSGRVRYDSASGTVTLDDIEGRDDRLSLEVDGTIQTGADPPGLRLRGRADGVPLDDELLKALPASIASLWKDLGIRGGKIDAGVVVSAQGGKDVRVGAALDFHEVRLRPSAFPYDLPLLAGRLRLSPGGEVDIERVSGARNGVSLSATGTVDVSGEKVASRVRIAASGLPVDDRLLEALPETTRQALADAGLGGGTVDVDLVVQGAGGPLTVDAEVALDGCSARPKAFPYAIRDLHGKLRWTEKSQSLALESVTGTHGPAGILLSGQMDFSRAKEPKFELQIQAANVALDDDLRAALPPEWLKLWQRHQPRGAIDLHGRLLSGEDGKLAFLGAATLRGCRIVAPQLPRPLEDIQGVVRMDPQSLSLEHVAASVGTSRVQVDAVQRQDKEGPRLETLSLVASDLRVDKALVASLPDPLRAKLAPLAPAGTLDLRLSYFDAGKEGPRTRVAATLRGLAVNAAPGGPRLTDLRGEVRSDGRTLILSALRGKLASTAVDLDGVVALEPGAGDTAVQIRLPRCRLTRAMLDAIPKPVAETLLPLNPTGTVEASASIRSSTPDAAPHLDSASIAFEDVVLTTEPRMDRLSGTLTFLAQAASPGSSVVALSLSRARVAGLSCQDLSLHGLLKPGSLDVQDMDWALYGGRVSGQLRFQTAEPLAYAGQLQVAHLDLESLLSAFGDPKNAPSGWLRGTIEFEGKGSKLSALELKGACKVDRGRLYELPLITAIWNLLAFQVPAKGTLTDAYTEFRIRDSVLHIDHFVLTGRSMPLDITGTIALDPGRELAQQKIDLLFTVARQPQILDQLPLIGWVKEQSYDRLTGYFLQASATGTLGEPKVNVLPKLLVDPIGGFWSVLRRVASEGVPAARNNPK